MKLRKYIQWAKKINEYDISPNLAVKSAWGFKPLDKNIKIPNFDLKGKVQGEEGYSSVKSKQISEWAIATWPELQSVEAKIQIQASGERCDPHLDFLGNYLERACSHFPELLDIDHSLDTPGIDVWRLFVAIDDHVPGQVFDINGKKWKWKRGEGIRLNNWQALHWTENTSGTDRILLKITGIKL